MTHPMCHHLNETKLLERKKFRSEEKSMGEHAFIRNRTRQRHTQIIKAENGKKAQVGGYSSLAKKVLERSALHNNIHGTSDKSQSKELFDEEGPKKLSKRIDAWPLEHDQAGRGARPEFSICMPKVGCSKVTSCTAPEDGNANMWSGAWNTTNNESCHGGSSQGSIILSIPCNDVWNKPTILAQGKDEHARREAGDWPKWETLSNQSSEQYSVHTGTYHSKEPQRWTSLQDCKNKESDSLGKSSPQLNYINGETDGLDMTLNQSNVDGWKQHNLIPSMSSIECWRKSRNSSTLLNDKAEKRIGGSSKDDVHQSHVDGGRQSSSIFNVMHRGGQNKSKCWSLPGNTKRETVGWPRWETVVTVSSKQCCNTSKGWAARDYGNMRKTGEESKFEHKYGNGNKEIVELDVTESKSYHDGRRHHNCSYTTSTKRGSSVVEDGKAKREAGDAGDAFDHNGLDGWGQSSPDICMVDRGSSCKSAFWDTTKFSNMKMETKGWHKGVAAVSKASRQCPNSQNRKGSCNQSQGWTTSEDTDSLKENDGRNPDLDRCGDPHMQQSIEGSLSKSACWDTTEVGKWKDTSMWSKWGSTISETKRQCTGNQNRQDYSNQSQGCTALKDVDSLKKNVGMNLDIIRSGSLWMQQIDNESLIMSTGWDIPEAGDEKKETGAWPKWGATMSVTSRQCPYSQKRQCGLNKFLGWNVSEDSDLQKEIGSMDPDLDQSGPSNKGSLSKIAGWDKAEVCNGKGVAGGWPKWYAAVSVTNVQCLSSQNRTDGLNKSQGLTTSQDGDSREGNNGRISDLDQNGDLQEIGGRNPDLDQGGDQLMQNSNEGSPNKCAGWEKPEDCNGKREAGGWPKWDAALSAIAMQCTSSQKRKGSRNQSQGRTNSQDGDSQKGNGGSNSDLGQTGNPPMQQSTKGSLSKSACWDTTEVGKQKDTSMRLKCGSTMSETKRQCTGNQNRQDYLNQSQGCTALKHVDSLKKNVGMNLDIIESGSPWMQHIDKGSLILSTGWDIPKAGNEKKETGTWPKWGATMSVTSGQWPYSQKRQCGWNKFLGWNASEDSDLQKEIGSMDPDLDQSGHPSNKGSLSMIAGCDKAEDCDGKEVSGGWPKWDAALSVTNAQCPRNQKRKDGWNESQGWTTSQDGDSQEGNNCRISDLDQNGDPEVGDFQKEIGGRNPDLDQDGDQLTQNNNEGSPSKCAGWEKPEDCNGKREAGGWPYWDVAPAATEMHSPSSQKRKVCWNQSQGGTKSQDGDSQKGYGGRNPELGQTGDTKDDYLQKEIDDRNPDLDQNGDSWMQHSSKGSLSKSAGWEKPEDCNGKEAGGWPKWDAVPSAIYEKCPSNQKRRGSWNQSQGWTTSQDGDSRKGIIARNTDLHHSGDPWIQHRPMAFPRCEWNKSSSWTASYGDSVIRDCRKKGSGSDQIGGESRKRLNPTVSSKVCWRKSGSLALAEGSGSIREKGEWGVSSDFVNRNAFKQHRSALSPKVCVKRPYRSRNRIPSPVWKRGHYRSNERYIIGAVDVAKPYKYSPTGSSRRESQLQQYSDRDLEEFRESKKARCLGHGRQQRFDDPWKRTDHLQGCLSLSHGSPSKDVENNELRRHDRSCYELLKRRSSRTSNCRYVTGGFPLKDEYKEMNNDTRDCTPQFGRRVDSHLGYNVPLKYFMKQDCGQSEEFDSSLPGMLHGSLEGKNSDYKPDDSMNVSKLSSWNGFKVCKETMIYPHSQTHPLRVDECFRAETIKSMVITSECSADQDVHQSTHDWKNQKNPSICHQNHLKHDSPSEIQNDYTNPTIQFKQNMQFNSQVPSSSTLNQSQQLILQHGSYRNEEVQNNEHQAMPKGEPFRRNDNFYDTSLIQDLNVTEIKTPQNSKSWNASHSEPVVVQDNGEKKIVSEVEKGDGARLGMVGMDDKGILMFKCALAGFVKEIIKPIWKEGRLSKDAHKTVVKKVVDKVVGVLGTSIPQTKERIDQYMSYSEHKLKKLAQDYMEVFINS